VFTVLMEREPPHNVVISPHAITRALLLLARIGNAEQRRQIGQLLGSGDFEVLEEHLRRSQHLPNDPLDLSASGPNVSVLDNPGRSRVVPLVPEAGFELLALWDRAGAVTAESRKSLERDLYASVHAAGEGSMSEWVQRNSKAEFSERLEANGESLAVFSGVHAKIAMALGKPGSMRFDSPVVGQMTAASSEGVGTLECHGDHVSVRNETSTLVTVEFVLPRDRGTEYSTRVAPASICWTGDVGRHSNEPLRWLGITTSIPAFDARMTLDIMNLAAELGVSSLADSVGSILHVAHLSIDSYGINGPSGEPEPMPHPGIDMLEVPYNREYLHALSRHGIEHLNYDGPFGVIVRAGRRFSPVLYAAWIVAPRRATARSD
jgi:hypothetical protein